jgi:hypothetical protein
LNFDIEDEAEVGVDSDEEGEVDYDVKELDDRHIVSKRVSLALEQAAYISKKRGLKETGNQPTYNETNSCLSTFCLFILESYASLINTLVFGGTMMDSTATTSTNPDAIEEVEYEAPEHIKTQGAYIANATKNAYRPVFADYKV